MAQSEARPRSRGIAIRVTDAEHRTIRENAARTRLSVASYVRRCALRESVQLRAAEEILRQVFRLARQVQALGDGPEEQQAMATMQGLIQILRTTKP